MYKTFYVPGRKYQLVDLLTEVYPQARSSFMRKTIKELYAIFYKNRLDKTKIQYILYSMSIDLNDIAEQYVRMWIRDFTQCPHLKKIIDLMIINGTIERR